MICLACKRETDGRNHNNRGLRCTFCWELLPTASPEEKPPGAAEKMHILTSNAHFNNVMLGCNATARAQALAATRGIDLSGVTGTGKDGRITVGDVRRAAQTRKKK